MKYLQIFLIATIVFCNEGSCCSMYKLTQDGKTIVGNNEDWLVANSQVWFEPKGSNLFGVMNIGFNDGLPQGSMNEAGLMFDGFAMPHLEIKNSKGKRKVPYPELIATIMHNFSSVEEVKEHLSKIDLSYLSKSMLVFVDSRGTYLIVEGDLMIIGNDAEHSFANFYPSQITNQEEVDLEFFQNGIMHLNESKPEASFNYCGSVMNNFQQFITQYTTIYDLQERKIRLYHYQNYEDFIELDLVEELKKGKRKMSIPELFPKQTKGYKYYRAYNNSRAITEYYRNFWLNDNDENNTNSKKLSEAGMIQILNIIANDWSNTKEDKKGAISILQLIVELFPKNYKGYDILANAFYMDSNYELAIFNYSKSLELNPKNELAKKNIKKINKMKRKH